MYYVHTYMYVSVAVPGFDLRGQYLNLNYASEASEEKIEKNSVLE